MAERIPHPRVLLLSPFGTRINPYIGSLRDGLVAAGAEVSSVNRLDSGTFGAGDSPPDVIHLHWLEHYDLPAPLAPRILLGAADLPRRALRRAVVTVANHPVLYEARRWLRLRRLLTQLRGFRRRGGRVAYTVHNLAAHEGSGPAERWAAATLVGLVDVVHVHDASTAAAVADRFGRREGVYVVPHGHYLDSYPNTVGRTEARNHLGLPESSFVYVTLGLLRPYKGLEELLGAFRSLPGGDARLVLAGEPGSLAFAETLAGKALGDPRILLVPHFVPPDEVQYYLNAADICVLPYRQVTTSGAAILAFSFGLPVIAPARGAFPELVADGRGILYDPADPVGLAGALTHARRTDWQGTRARMMAWISQFDWETIGKQLLAAYAHR